MQNIYGMAGLLETGLVWIRLQKIENYGVESLWTFDNLRNNRTLTAYTLNGYKGFWSTFNNTHYSCRTGRKPVWKFGRWAETSPVTWASSLQQERVGKKINIKPGRVAHDKEFVAKCESLGLHPCCWSHYICQQMECLLISGWRARPFPTLSEEPREDKKKDWFR